MRDQPYLFLSSVASDVNETDSSFDLITKQYTTYYKTEPDSSILPIRAHFNSNKFKKNKPPVKDNYNVGVLGFLDDVDTEPSGEAVLFHVAIEIVNFIRPINVSPSK